MKEEYRRWRQWLILAVCMIAVIIFMLYNFLTKMKRDGAAFYENDMTEIADNHAEQINSELMQVKTAGETVAQIIALDKTADEKEIIDAITAVFDCTEAYEVIYHKGKGAGINHEGKELDLTQCTYYRIIFRASDVKCAFVKNDGMGGQEAVLFVIPIGDSIEENLLVYYPVERIGKMLRVNSEFDSDAFAALIDLDGNIIKRSDHQSEFFSGPNFWANISIEYRTSINKAKVQIMGQLPGCFEARAADEEKTVVYAPTGINDWIVVIGVDQSFVDKREKRYWQDGIAMVYQLLAVVCICLLIFAVINISNKKKNEEHARLLREEAETDLLTGLSNKLATERKIREYIEEYPKSLAMMFVLDIDNFKKINDTMGHAFGDEVLRSLGKSISSVFRVTDIIGRTGGDEFTIFLKFLNDDGNTQKEAEKLVNFFKDFTIGEYVKYSATASIGVAVFPAHGSDFETLYKSADKALYKAKQRGKNQLAFFDDRDRTAKEKETV